MTRAWRKIFLAIKLHVEIIAVILIMAVVLGSPIWGTYVLAWLAYILWQVYGQIGVALLVVGCLAMLVGLTAVFIKDPEKR